MCIKAATAIRAKAAADFKAEEKELRKKIAAKSKDSEWSLRSDFSMSQINYNEYPDVQPTGMVGITIFNNDNSGKCDLSSSARNVKIFNDDTLSKKWKTKGKITITMS